MSYKFSVEEEEEPCDTQCCEGSDAHQAWQDALTNARVNGETMENIYNQAWTAAHDSLDANEDMSDEEKGQALACIGVQLGFTTGHETCNLVDTTVQHLVEDGHDASDAEEWTEEEVKELYTWYEGYNSLCGERPTYEEQDTSA